MESNKRKPLSIWKAVAAIGVSAFLIGGIVVAQQTEQPFPPQQQQPEAPTGLEQELQQIQAELQAIGQQLSGLQQRAMDDPAVAEAISNFEGTIHGKMIERAPEMEAEVRRQAELSAELRTEEASQAPDFQERVMEYQELRQQLMPVEQEVIMDEEVQAIREDLENTMRQAIIAMDPQAEQLIDRQEELSEEFARLQQELIQQQQQQQEGAEQPAFPPEQQPAQPQPEAPTALEQELQQIQAELQAIGQQLSGLQEQAMDEPTVAEAISNFEETINEKMIERAPEMEAQIRRQAALSEELRAEGATEAPDFQEKIMEYQELRQQLMPIEQEVTMDEEVQAIREDVENTMQQAIVAIDPQAEELIQRQEQLSEEFTRLQQELIQQQQQQQEGAEPAPAPAPDQPAAPQPPVGDADGRLEGIQQQLQAISMQLSEVQQAAFERPEVQERIESFENTMIEHMIALAPEREDEIERLNELTSQLRDEAAQEDPEQFQQQVMEYQQLKQGLSALEEQVMDVPEVQQALEEFEEIIIAAMNEIDPQTEELLEQRNELVREFNAIQQELMQEQAPQQPAPQ